MHLLLSQNFVHLHDLGRFANVRFSKGGNIIPEMKGCKNCMYIQCACFWVVPQRGTGITSSLVPTTFYTSNFEPFDLSQCDEWLRFINSRWKETSVRH